MAGVPVILVRYSESLPFQLSLSLSQGWP